MKPLITIIALLAFTTTQAQIGNILNKAKEKATKPAETKPASSTSQPASTGASKPASTSSSTNKTHGKSSATNPWGTGSPASYEIGVLKSTMDELKQKHGSALYSGKIDAEFDKARGYIAKIKTKDPEWDIAPEEKLVEEYWDKYQKLIVELKKDEQMDEILRDVKNAVQGGVAIGTIKYKYADYIAYRDLYAKKYADKQADVDAAEKYFNELFPQYLDGDLFPELKSKMPNFNDDNAKMDPHQAIYTLKNYIEVIDYAVGAVKTGTPQEQELKKYQSAYKAEKEKFEKFQSSGEFDTFKATKAAEIVAKQRFPKTAGSNATFEQGAKNRLIEYHASEKLTFLRSGLQTANWEITTFPSGTPNYRQHVAIVGLKSSNGKCYFGYVFIKEKYSFGKWTGVYVYQYTGDRVEILCDNMAK